MPDWHFFVFVIPLCILHRLKEYEDVARFDLVAYMVENNTTVIGDDNANLDEEKKKEEYEYFEARNKQDISEKQVSL